MEPKPAIPRGWVVTHDDVIKWKHFPRNWPFVRGIHRSPVNSPHKGQWRGALMFSLICVWINDWVNNREAGDLTRNQAHYGVIVMLCDCGNTWIIFLNMHTLSNKICSKHIGHPLDFATNSFNHDDAINCRHLYWLLNRLFRWRSKKPSKLRVISFCEGNPPVNDGFPSQRAIEVENVSIWLRHHDTASLRKPSIMIWNLWA